VTTVFFVALAQDLGRGAAVTVGFCLSFALARLWHVFNLRMAGTGLIRNKVVCNRWIRYAIAVCLVLTAAAVWLPGLSTVLEGCRWTVRAGLWFWPAASRRFWWDRRRWPLCPASVLAADRPLPIAKVTVVAVQKTSLSASTPNFSDVGGPLRVEKVCDLPAEFWRRRVVVRQLRT
jgi:hypothetical protein